jgi:hypothetical protein
MSVFSNRALTHTATKMCSYAAFVQHGLKEFSAYLFYEVTREKFLNETRGAKHESTVYKTASAGKRK